MTVLGKSFDNSAYFCHFWVTLYSPIGARVSKRDAIQWEYYAAINRAIGGKCHSEPCWEFGKLPNWGQSGNKLCLSFMQNGSRYLIFSSGICALYSFPKNDFKHADRGIIAFHLGVASKLNRRLTHGSGRLALFRTIGTGRNRRPTGGWVLKPSLMTLGALDNLNIQKVKLQS